MCATLNFETNTSYSSTIEPQYLVFCSGSESGNLKSCGYRSGMALPKLQRCTDTGVDANVRISGPLSRQPPPRHKPHKWNALCLESMTETENYSKVIVRLSTLTRFAASLPHSTFYPRMGSPSTLQPSGVSTTLTFPSLKCVNTKTEKTTRITFLDIRSVSIRSAIRMASIQ